MINAALHSRNRGFIGVANPYRDTFCPGAGESDVVCIDGDTPLTPLPRGVFCVYGASYRTGQRGRDA